MATKLFDTEFPTYRGRDLKTLERMLLEKFKRHYSTLLYYQLSLDSTAIHEATTSPVSVATAGKTVVDDLWGEAVPPEMAGEWLQPHDDDDIHTTHPEKFKDPIELNVRVKKESTDTEVTKYAIDKSVELNCRVLKKQVREKGASLGIGDEFIWRKHRYRVEHTHNSRGRFGETTAYVYTDFVATAVRVGS